jgi:competence protein ComEA
MNNEQQADSSEEAAESAGGRQETPASGSTKGWIERYRAVLFLSLIVGILAGIVLFQTQWARPNGSILDSLTPAPSPEATRTPKPLQVYVTGAVQRPDVYALPAGSIVKDALLAAGGAAADADLVRINLAHSLADGEQVYVPRQGEESLPTRLLTAPAASVLQPGASRININTAGETELESLPGIGPALAKRILEYREAHGPFQAIDEIDNVPGIGPVLLEEIRDLITID